MKNKIRALLIDGEDKTVNEVKKYFSSSTVVEVEYFASDGMEGINLLKKYHDEIDVVIMDTLLSKKDGLSVLEELSNMEHKFKTILTCSARNNIVFSRMDDYDIDYILLKPYNPKDLENVINSIFNKNIINENSNLENRITKMLHSLGIPSHIKGYQYIRESILLIYRNPYIVGGITKELYPTVADKYRTTSSRVERAIRHAIEVSWNRGDYDYMEELFGHSVDYDRAKPTNSEFIATVADKLRLDLNSYVR